MRVLKKLEVKMCGLSFSQKDKQKLISRALHCDAFSTLILNS